jgi:hypothetical protein
MIMSFLKFINESFDKNYNLGSDRIQKTSKKKLPVKRTRLHESMLDIADKLEGVDSQHKLGKKRFPDKCKNGKCTDEVLTEDRDEYTDVIQVVADYFNVPVEDITQSSWDDRVYELPNGEEYLVIHEDDVYDEVRKDVEGIFDDIGMESFTPFFQEWILYNAMDLDWFEEAQRESFASYFDDITRESSDTYENRAIEELYDAGIIDDDDFDTDDEGEVDYNSFNGDADDYVDEYVDYMVDQADEPVRWFISEFGKKSFSDTVKEHNLIDMDMVIDECLDVDGAAPFLARYDGKEHEIGGPYLAYRQN